MPCVLARLCPLCAVPHRGRERACGRLRHQYIAHRGEPGRLGTHRATAVCTGRTGTCVPRRRHPAEDRGGVVKPLGETLALPHGPAPMRSLWRWPRGWRRCGSCYGSTPTAYRTSRWRRRPGPRLARTGTGRRAEGMTGRSANGGGLVQAAAARAATLLKSSWRWCRWAVGVGGIALLRHYACCLLPRLARAERACAD